MRIIRKKISLEPYISRINGTLTSYNEYGVKQPFSTYDGQNMNNYGMFPLDVIYNGKVLSYPTLMERYYFCKRYEEMLKYDNCIDGGKYLNAVTYYTHNFIYQTEELKKEYEDLDALYKEYGGSGFTNWCNSILKGTQPTYSEDTAHINIQILFTNTIDDLGEYSIFCEEWENGIEYQEDDLVIFDDRIWKKTSGGTGSIYSTKYKETYFPQIGENGFEHLYDRQWYDKSKDEVKISGDTKQWEDYTDYFFNGNVKVQKCSQLGTTDYTTITGVPDDIKDIIENGKLDCIPYNTYVENVLPIGTTSYTVKNGKSIYNPTPKDVASVYDIITNGDLGFYVINDVLFKPFKHEYIKYGDLYIFVYECENFIQLNMKYCYIKGQKIFSKTDDGTNHYFIIDGTTITVNDKDTFIDYNGNAIKVTSNKVIIQNITYNKIDSYSIIEGKRYYISSDKIITFKRNDKGTEYSISDLITTDLGIKTSTPNDKTYGYGIENGKVYVFIPYNTYEVNKVTGYTESKLSSLINYIRFKDDVGNEIPGSFKQKADGTYEMPSKILELPYKVGNVSDLTILKYDTDGKTPLKIFGNKLTKISFYYVDYYGNIIEDSKVECGENDSLLDAITTCKTNIDTYCTNNTKKIGDEHYLIQNDIRCNIEYQMGAIMDKSFAIDSNGVIYKEEVTLELKTFDYMFDDVSSKILYYYEFKYNETYDKLNEYGNAYVKVGKSYFEHTIDDVNSNNINVDRAKHDGMIAAPLIREEYKIGSSSLENIQADIYIDRGFSSSFEKHVNLLNVKSMEALENFGNGFYNIIES